MTHCSLGPKGRFNQAKRLKETTPLRHVKSESAQYLQGLKYYSYGNN